MNDTSTAAAAALDPAGIARAFHEAYELLAPSFGYETREASAKPWEDVPAQNRDLMTATVGRLLADGVIAFPLDRDALYELAAKWAADAKRLDSVAQPERTPAERAVAASAETFARCALGLLAAIGQPS